MKKFSLLLLLIVTLLSVASCFKKPEHTHDYPSEWMKDEAGHWKACAGEGCDSRAAEAEHSFDGGTSVGDGNTKYKCTVCGFEKTSHEHSLSKNFSFDEKEHWSECIYSGCEHRDEVSAHTFGDPTHNGAEEVFVCSLCGFMKSAAHNHSAKSEWEHDDDAHWKGCSFLGCKAKLEGGSHDWTSEGFTKEPTEDEVGIERFSCYVCGATEDREVEYIPPKMSEEAWRALFVFDNLKLKNTYTLGGEEYSDIWQIDGDNILITSEGKSFYGSLSDLEAFAFFANKYSHFKPEAVGRYTAFTVMRYDPELQETLIYKNVTVTFSENKLTSITYTVDLGALGEMTDSYEFLEWGGITVPDNPREVVTSPEEISDMLGNSLDNYTLVESVFTGDETFFEAVYLFDGSRYSYAEDGEDEVTDIMANAGKIFACDNIGFFYCLDPEGFVPDEELSTDTMRFYRYRKGLTVDGIDVDGVLVALHYEDGEVTAVSFFYTLILMGEITYQYTFGAFGEVVLPEAGGELVYEILDTPLYQASVLATVFDGSDYVSVNYAFDYSDYSYGTGDYELAYEKLKDAGPSFITAWLGTLTELYPADFRTVTNTASEKVYTTSKPVTSLGVTYASTEVRLVYYGSKAEGYTLGAVEIRLTEGDNGGYANYVIGDFGSVLIDPIPEEEREIPEGYITLIAKEGTLENYKLIINEKLQQGSSVIGESNLVYEFDKHKGRSYLLDTPDVSEYYSGDYIGMAYATGILEFFIALDQSKFTSLGIREYWNITIADYKYGGDATLDGEPVTNIQVRLVYDNGALDYVGLSYDIPTETEQGEAVLSVTYKFASFGEMAVVLPEDETVVKYGSVRFDTENYAYTVVITEDGYSYFSGEGIYDGARYFEKSSYGTDTYGAFYYTENAGKRDFNLYFRGLFEAFPADELGYAAYYDYEGFDFAAEYSSGAMKKLRVPFIPDSYDVAVANLRLTFFYNGGTLDKIRITYDATTDVEVFKVEATLFGFGEQAVILPSDRDLAFDPESTDELCGSSLDNFMMNETVYNSGSLVSAFSGSFEKDFAKTETVGQGAASFKGEADHLGKQTVSEKLGFLYTLDPTEFTLLGGELNTLSYAYGKEIAVASGTINDLVVTLEYLYGRADGLHCVTVTFNRTSDGVTYNHTVAIFSFGQVSLERVEPQKQTLSEDIYNALLSPEKQSHASLNTKKSNANGTYYEVEAAYSTGSAYFATYEILFNDFIDFRNSKQYSYTTLDEAKAGYQEHFALFLDALSLISPSKLTCNEGESIYAFSGRITFGSYQIRSVHVNLVDESSVTVEIFCANGNETLTLLANISLK